MGMLDSQTRDPLTSKENAFTHIVVAQEAEVRAKLRAIIEQTQ